jgi:2-oxoisovalerate dehydrogenase E2 component (dihydrolipoyl transacylase)
MIEVTLDALADGMQEATINYWYHEEGDHLEEGSDLVEVVSEEGTFKIQAPRSGILGEVYFSEGETVSVGEALCEIEED